MQSIAKRQKLRKMNLSNLWTENEQLNNDVNEMIEEAVITFYCDCVDFDISYAGDSLDVHFGVPQLANNDYYYICCVSSDRNLCEIDSNYNAIDVDEFENFCDVWSERLRKYEIN